jgi:hypothetical protein
MFRFKGGAAEAGLKLAADIIGGFLLMFKEIGT